MDYFTIIILELLRLLYLMFDYFKKRNIIVQEKYNCDLFEEENAYSRSLLRLRVQFEVT